MNEDPNTPGSKALVVMKELDKEVEFKKPSGIPKRRSRQKILDEETYIEVRFTFIAFHYYFSIPALIDFVLH